MKQKRKREGEAELGKVVNEEARGHPTTIVGGVTDRKGGDVDGAGRCGSLNHLGTHVAYGIGNNHSLNRSDDKTNAARVSKKRLKIKSLPSHYSLSRNSRTEKVYILRKYKDYIVS